MRALLRAHGVSDRVVWACDSFEGMPKPNAVKYRADQGYDLSEVEYLSVSLERVEDNFRRFGLLDEQVRFVKGWFRDSLPNSKIGRVAVLRLDGDLYESTMDSLTALYDRVSTGGFVIVDDYGDWPPCKQAVHDFRNARKITDKIEMIDACGAYWRRS